MWASLAASLLVGLLKFLVQREDTKRAILAEVERQQAHRALEALGWMAGAAARPDGGGDLRVRPGGTGLQFPGGDAGPGGAAGDGPVSPGPPRP